MNYKIGDKLNVIIRGFSPCVARIDNITEKNGQRFYHISFQEEHLYTICRVVSERELQNVVDTYNNNKDRLDEFMMKKEGAEIGNEKSGQTEETPHDKNDAFSGGGAALDITSDAQEKVDVKAETDMDVTMNSSAGSSLVGLTSQKG